MSAPPGAISPATLALLDTAYGDLVIVASDTANYLGLVADVTAAQALAATSQAALLAAQAQANADAMAAIAAVQADLGITPSPAGAAPAATAKFPGRPGGFGGGMGRPGGFGVLGNDVGRMGGMGGFGRGLGGLGMGGLGLGGMGMGIGGNPYVLQAMRMGLGYPAIMAALAQGGLMGLQQLMGAGMAPVL
jgi:hypothetical protein